MQKTGENNKRPISNVTLQLITVRKLTRKDEVLKNVTRISKLAVLIIKCVQFYHNYTKGQSNSFQRDKEKKKNKVFRYVPKHRTPHQSLSS